jgi:hypothetical protein
MESTSGEGSRSSSLPLTVLSGGELERGPVLAIIIPIFYWPADGEHIRGREQI